ncbi:hypothetical protein TSOC_008637 [Tetrabaena socialis]|uniref:Uncharacterized protein n=1 Tax=Tetrabaena socialis TaxID=47790 RepID=A0A2J7ZXZ3_9CHLO|nr:hypothetical protein TSOC_008637 [Tetrabaena socialis]|eukprot:PNH05140.1 hypothetical protein TSOC_008637 [Tetrabaena socialis]
MHQRPPVLLAPLSHLLAAKLQPLDQAASSILAAVEERKGGGGTPLVKATAKDFVVGRATCASSSVVTLFPDRMEYKFSHSTQGRIDMVMFTKQGRMTVVVLMCMLPPDVLLQDMVAPELDSKSLVLKFHVGKPLRHFVDAYDSCDPAHVLALTFHEKADASQFADALASGCKLPLQVVGGGF